MWGELKVYRQLAKEEINPTFKKLGTGILAELNGYRIDQTQSMIKLFREINQLEQSIFIEKSSGDYTLKINTCIKPVDFYRRHKFTLSNIVPLGDIMNNHRRTSYPLTEEWKELAVFLGARIKEEIEKYFEKYNTYEKIIADRKNLEKKAHLLSNTYGLLIYGAIRTNNKSLLLKYVAKEQKCLTHRITHSEFLKRSNVESDVAGLLLRIRRFAEKDDFESIELEIAAIVK